MYKFRAQLLPLSKVIFEKPFKKQAKTMKKYIENAHLCPLLRDKSKVEHETYVMVFYI